MSRFYFHVSSQDGFVPDHDGAELEDIRAAHQFALRFIDKILASYGDFDWSSSGIQVADEQGTVLMTVLFRAATNRRPLPQLDPPFDQRAR